MKKKSYGYLPHFILVTILLCTVIAMLAAAIHGQKQLKNELDTLESFSITEAANPAGLFDTQILENWCGGGEEGQIRMVGAWKYGEGANGIIVCDETGNLWDIGDREILDDDFILLWIADNNSENTTDDILIKVWIESYEAVG